MEFAPFLSRLRRIRFVDRDEFVDAGLDPQQWPAFRDHPAGWFVTASDADARKLWDWIEGREPPGQLAGPG